MPHVAFVPLSGFRIREQELAALGMTLPGAISRARAVGQLPALGLLTLAGMLPRHWTCSYYPACTVDDELLEALLARRPDMVAVSALTASIDEAYSLSRNLRRRRIPVVLGGLHVTACPQEAQAHCDAVVVGSGEASWPRVLADAEQRNLKPIYRATDESPWPVPQYGLLGAAPSRFTLQTQRGCPFACQFCAASRLLGRFREKPVDSIRRELLAINELDPRPLIELADDNTFAGDRDVNELFAVLSEANVSYFTESDWRIGERPDVLRGLAASGCVQVLVGIESLVFRYPGMGEKAAALARIVDAVNAIQEAGVAVNGCFIVGADGETNDSLDRLVEFILASPLAEVQITLQTPFPGTALYGQLKQQYRLLSNRGWSYYTLFDVTYRPDRLTVAELEQGFRRVVSAVYGSSATGRRQAIRRSVWRRHPRFAP